MSPPSSANDAPAPDIRGLTRRLATGDERAFSEFHALYFDRLYHFLLIVTQGQEHAAQDAMQETLVRVARHAREFDREEVFWGWLKAIARNVARDGGRKRRRYLALLERFTFRREPPAPAPRAEDLRGLLNDALAQLAPSDRQLVERKYVHGASVRDLAEETGLTEKAIESRLLRLRRQLSASVLHQLRAP